MPCKNNSPVGTGLLSIKPDLGRKAKREYVCARACVVVTSDNSLQSRDGVDQTGSAVWSGPDLFSIEVASGQERSARGPCLGRGICLLGERP